MNPLLPPAFVRGPSPFDSMDLSLQSSRGSGSGALTKASGMPTAQHEYTHQKHAQHQQQQQQLHANQHNQQQMQHNTNVNYSPIHNLSTNPAASLIHPQQQQQQQQSHSNMSQHALGSMQCASSVLTAGSNVAPKYITSNGNECEPTMLPPASVASNATSNLSSSGAMTSPVHYMREVESNYGKLAHLKRSYESNEQSAMHKPVELVNKECPYPASMQNKIGNSNQQQQQQQHATSKKPSPLRSFHANTAHNQLQQQQHMPYGNTTPNKRNGPHTPPTPQSPIMHQASPTMPTHSAQQQHQMLSGSVGSLVSMSHGNSTAPLDFNQLHLQQQQQSVYGMQQTTHQHQQHSQHMSFPAQHSQNQHQQQQQQQQHRMMQLSAQQQQQQSQQMHSHQQSLHMQNSPHLMHSPQTPPHQQSLQQQQHQLAPTRQHQPHSPHMPHTPQSAQRSPLSQFPKRTEEKPHQPETSPNAESTAPHTAAITAATTYTTYSETMRGKTNIPDAPDSPDITTSNEESLDSNSTSSGSRLRRKRKSSNVVRITSSKQDSEPEADEINTKAAPKTPPLKPSETQVTTNNNDNNGKSPVSSPPPAPLHKSPKRSSFPSPVTMASSPLPHNATPALLLNQLNKTEIALAQANGRRSPSVQQPAQLNATEHEAAKIEQIASMLTKTTSNDNNSNSNFSHKSLDLSLFDSGSPKTKKQRQALKLRNAELLQTNSNGSTASSTFNEHANPSNDNAVQAAEELQRETTVIKAISTTPTPQRASRQTLDDTQSVSMERTLSPHSNSRSSSSSSSSSSCSRTTHSSSASKAKVSADVEDQPIREEQTKAEEVTARDDSAKSRTPQNMEDQQEIDEAKLGVDSKDINNAAQAPPVKPCTFEEVENKLEEMFAGIEDEPAAANTEDEEPTVQAPVNGTEIVKDLSLALEFSTNTTNEQKPKTTKTLDDEATAAAVKDAVDENGRKTEKLQLPAEANIETKFEAKQPIANITPTHTPMEPTVNVNSVPAEPVKVDRPIATKAAKKSTEPSQPVKSKTPPPQQSTSTQEFPTKRLPPRRRLSVGMDPAYLRISIETQPELNTRSLQRGKKTEANNKLLAIHLDDEKPTTSAAAAAAAASSEAKASKANGTKKNGNVTPANNRTKVKNAKTTPAAAHTDKKSKNAKKSSKQSTQQKQKRKQTNSSSSDESDSLPLSTTRDNLNNAAALNATNTALATVPTAVVSTTQNGFATETKYKSPYVLIKKDGSISVINAPTAEDMNEKQIKKPMPKYTHDRKKIRGLHCSTLGNKYDADTIDSTWICVFCKRGPHKMGLGDLFGPYEVTINCDEYRVAVGQTDANEFDGEFGSKRRRIDMVQTNERNLPVVPATLMHMKSGQAATHKKKKKSVDDIAQLMPSSAPAQLNLTPCSDIKIELDHTFQGMCKNSETTYEVWMHEDCLVWAPDVFLVGARITGLDAAVWNSQRYHCALCSNSGAMICCLQRDCKAPAHIPCAREAGWHLDEKHWHVYCHKHIPNDILNATTSMSALHALCTTPTVYS